MDLDFFRRRRPVTVSLSALLARTSAVQGASETARAQVRLNASVAPQLARDPHVALFAEGQVPGGLGGEVASFASVPGDNFSPRQSN